MPTRHITITTIILLIGMGLFLLSGCEETSTNEREADSLVQLAVAELEAAFMYFSENITGDDSLEQVLDAMDVAAAYNHFDEAHSLDPENSQASFGLGFTTILMITQDQSMRDLMLEWDAYFSAGPFRIAGPFLPASILGPHIGYAAIPDIARLMELTLSPMSELARPSDGIPQFSDLQDLISNVVLPMVESGITSFANVQSDSAFTFTLGIDLDPEDAVDHVQFDQADVYALNGGLSAIKGFLRTMLAYNFDFASHDSAGILTELDQDSDFATLLPDGGMSLSSARSAFLITVAFMQSTYDQSNDFITFSGPDEMDSISVALAEAEAALNGPAMMALDEDDPTDSTLVDISAFFTEPINDFKALLPPYEIGTQLDTMYEWDNLVAIIYHVEDSVVADLPGYTLNNSNVTLTFLYDKSPEATILQGSLVVDLFTFPISPETLYMFPATIQEAYAEFITYTEIYDLDTYVPHAHIWLHWSGTITEGESLEISADLVVEAEYMEGIYVAPEITWDADDYSSWLASWPDPTFNQIFPEMNHADLEDFLDLDPSDWSKTGP